MGLKDTMRMTRTTIDETVLTAVIPGVADKDVGNIADGALGVGIIGTRAAHPGVAVRDVNLAFCMGESKEATRNDRDEIPPGMRSQWPIQNSRNGPPLTGC